MPSVNVYPNQDGYVKYDFSTCNPCDPSAGYVDWGLANTPWIWASIRKVTFGGGDDPVFDVFFYRRGYAFADLSSLPVGITFTKVEYNIITSPITNSTRDTKFYQEALQHDDYADAQALFNGLDDGSVYIQGVYDTVAPTVQTIDLGSQAVTDVNSHKTWFGVGVLIDEDQAGVDASGFNKTYYSAHSNTDEHDYRDYFTFTYTENTFLPRLMLLGVT